MPTWLIGLLMGLPSILQLFQGGNDQGQTATQTTTASPTGYQSPTLGLMDLLMQGTLGKNLQMYGGAGMPGGQSIAPNFLQDFLNLIGSSYFDLQGKYQGGGTTPGVGNPRYREPRGGREGRGRSYGDYAGR